MKLSNEVVEKICGMDHLSGKERTNKLGACENVASEVARIKRQIATAEDDHKSRMQLLAKDLQDARNLCHHDFTKYHADPAGGSDSFNECLVCGAEVGKSKLKGLDRP
jgi:hypothetical protein